MARLSKPPELAIYEDPQNTRIPTPNASRVPVQDDVIPEQETPQEVLAEEKGDDTVDDPNDGADTLTPRDAIHARNEVHENGSHNVDAEGDDERRFSAYTRTSVSSLPESNTETDDESSLEVYKPSYPSPGIRPCFRRAESVRRMQMSSPTPFDRSPRRSVLHHSRSRSGTPRTIRADARGSPRAKKSAGDGRDLGDETTEYPLILLHVTLLPVKIRWAIQHMEELLPANTMENLRLLRSKASETILHRGILISHPREEYELLEERLLEALELKRERVTKCGHFRARESISSTASSLQGSDSGLGSSGEDSEADFCHTCNNSLKPSGSVVGKGKHKWGIKVFAANGLVPASAWSSVWSEMERVDVEILPWIDEDLRRQLDEKQLKEEADANAKEEEEQMRIKAIVEEQVAIAHEARKRADEAQRLMTQQLANVQTSTQTIISPRAETSTPFDESMNSEQKEGFPQIYRPRDIPVTVLMKNYIFLLAQDRRNVALFVLVLVVLWLGLRAAFLPSGGSELLVSDIAVPQYALSDLPQPTASKDAEIEREAGRLTAPNGEDDPKDVDRQEHSVTSLHETKDKRGKCPSMRDGQVILDAVQCGLFV